MKPQLKAIPTGYNGYLFRSRLEAKWAVFFDLMKFDWTYETESHVQLPDGTWYLPDFHVTTPSGKDMWFEVKPRQVTNDPKFTQFRNALPLGTRATLLSGDPFDVVGDSQKRSHYEMCPLCGDFSAEDFEQYSNPPQWYRCELCDYEYDYMEPDDIGYGTREGVSGFLVTPHKGVNLLESNYNDFVKHLNQAAQTARSYRFGKGGRG